MQFWLDALLLKIQQDAPKQVLLVWQLNGKDISMLETRHFVLQPLKILL